MSRRDKPNYGIFNIPLDVKGSMDFTMEATRVVMIAAFTTATGAIAPTTIVSVAVGKALGDAIPFQVNTKINVDDAFEFIRLSWTAQPGIVATFLISDDRDGAGISIDSPLGVISGAITITNGSVDANIAKVNGVAVNVGVGASGTGTQRVAVSSDSFPSNMALNALPKSTAGVQQQANQIGNSTSFSASASGVTTATILASGSNTNGAIIRGASLSAGGSTISGFYGGTSAPSTNASNVAQFAVASNSGGSTGGTLQRDIYVPAGQGIYLYQGGAYPYSIAYDLL